MNVLMYYLIGFMIIWVLALILKTKFKNITVDGMVLMIKTERLRGTIDKIAYKCPKFWTWAMNLGIPVGIFFMVLMLISLILSLKLMFQTPTVSLILPGVDIPGSPLYIPLITGLLALISVMVVHEFGHGIIARVEGISIKSIGILLVAILPGAFVELNEDEIQKLNGLSKIRIYSAGALFNIALCIIALLIAMGISLFLASEQVYTTDGIEIASVVPNSPSEGILQQGMVITNINNHSSRTYSNYIYSFNNIHIGDTVTVQTNSGTYNITSNVSPNNNTKAFIGIRTKEHVVVTQKAKEKYGTFIPGFLSQFKELLYWIFLLNFAVGTFNLLPMKPLDGGLIFEELIKYRVTPERRIDFNNTLNGLIKYLPKKIQLEIKSIFNKILDFLSNHYINNGVTDKIMRMLSTALISVIVVLVIYGTVPGIIKML